MVASAAALAARLAAVRRIPPALPMRAASGAASSLTRVQTRNAALRNAAADAVWAGLGEMAGAAGCCTGVAVQWSLSVAGTGSPQPLIVSVSSAMS